MYVNIHSIIISRGLKSEFEGWKGTMITMISALIITCLLATAFLTFAAVKMGFFILKTVLHQFKRLFSKQTNRIKMSSIEIGKKGEDDLYSLLSGIPGNKRILRNLHIPYKNGGYAEIDMVMLTKQGIYVFEYKNYHCDVYVPDDINQKYWYRTTKGKNSMTYAFYSPLMQNTTHISALDEYLNGFSGLRGIKERMLSYVVFSDECRIHNNPAYYQRNEIMNLHNVEDFMKDDIVLEISLSDSALDILYTLLKPTETLNNCFQTFS